MRVFVAIPLPPELKVKLMTLQREFRQVPLDATWVREAAFHLTLKFLGEVQAARLESIAGAMTEAVQGFHPFSLRLKGVGLFPNVSSPRVVWVGLADETGRLARLQRELEERLALQGYPYEERPYRPHLTLARLKQVKQPNAFRTCVDRHRDDEIGHFEVHHVELLESQLHPAGARYSVISIAALAPSDMDPTG